MLKSTESYGMGYKLKFTKLLCYHQTQYLILSFLAYLGPLALNILT